MGGSAIGGDIVSALGEKDIDIPLIISRNYKLPNWVNENSLVICSSYSGNTEETLSCLEDALKKNAQICGITTAVLMLSGQYLLLLLTQVRMMLHHKCLGGMMVLDPPGLMTIKVTLLKGEPGLIVDSILQLSSSLDNNAIHRKTTRIRSI